MSVSSGSTRGVFLSGLRWSVCFLTSAFGCAFVSGLSAPAFADDAVRGGGLQHASCAQPENAIGVHRTITIDASSGPIFGAVTRREREASFLKKGEVVLTFDDGPLPGVTTRILEILSRECTRATFFSVGRMALAYPATYRKVVAAGHTVGGHTYSHAANMPSLPPEKAVDEIERGFAALTRVAGHPVAPFFRFPGLRDSDGLLGYLQSRGLATFTVDVISNDSFIDDPLKLTQKTMDQVRQRGGGIILFHDIKPVTARALPLIIKALREEGFKVVHLVAAEDFRVLPAYEGAFEVALSKSRERAPGVMDIAAQTGTQDILQPAAFDDAVRALSGDIETGTVGPQRVRSPIRPRKGAWRYLPPPVPQMSPARRGKQVVGTRARPAEIGTTGSANVPGVWIAPPTETSKPVGAARNASASGPWKQVDAPNAARDLSSAGAPPANLSPRE